MLTQLGPACRDLLSCKVRKKMMYDADNRVQTPSRVMEEVPAGYRHAGGQLVLSMYNIALCFLILPWVCSSTSGDF